MELRNPTDDSRYIYLTEYWFEEDEMEETVKMWVKVYDWKNDSFKTQEFRKSDGRNRSFPVPIG